MYCRFKPNVFRAHIIQNKFYQYGENFLCRYVLVTKPTNKVKLQQTYYTSQGSISRRNKEIDGQATRYLGINGIIKKYFVSLRPKLNKTLFLFNSMSHTIIGSKIKGLRETKQISIEEMAERSGLSVEQITTIENDETLPSLGPLIKIARALGVRLGTFMDDSDAIGPVVTRAAERESEKTISFSNGDVEARKHMEYHPLAQQKAGRHMEPFIIDIYPTEKHSFQLSAHEGEEFIYVMQGEVELEYGKEVYHLNEGDSIYYDSIVKHHLHGAPGKTAKILALVYIPF